MNTKRIETKECYYGIVNGPNKDTLLYACKYAYGKTTKFAAIDFEVVAGYTMMLQNHPERAYDPIDVSDVAIHGIEHEDGSGESFNIHGVCKAVLHGSSDDAKLYKFKAYYDAKTRAGTITFF